MLASLSIKNYALIENLKVDFKEGLSIITGETGAGKSILMGGLAMVLGKRADTSLVYEKSKKCIIEAEFDIGSYELKSFFQLHDLDYDPWVIIRREILPNGKSRSFVNDTPTTLSVLNKLSGQLIDIHSQHETLQLSDTEFQFHIVDSLADNANLLDQYQNGYSKRKELSRKLKEFELAQQQARNEYDYNLFLWDELNKADLIPGELESLESDLEKLTHLEDIKASLSGIIGAAERESLGAIEQLQDIDRQLNRIAPYAELYESLSERMKSMLIEFKDILGEVESENEQLVYDPEVLESVESRLQLLYNLKKKHGASTIEELITVRDQIQDKIGEVDEAASIKEELLAAILEVNNSLESLAGKIHKRRKAAIPEFENQIENSLGGLEMKNTRLKADLQIADDFLINGKDRLQFLMSSDKGKSYESIRKVASGGELSRIMLAVKWLLSKYANLPAIIFDEIDTGVSGEVSNRIAEVMRSMSANMQVITITHLPQVAAKGHHHYKVFKQEKKGGINSNIRRLNAEERVRELSEMLGGNKITASALAHAKQLLSS